MFIFSCIIIKNVYVLLITLCSIIIITFTLTTFLTCKLKYQFYFYCSENNWWFKHENILLGNLSLVYFSLLDNFKLSKCHINV